MSMLRKAYEVVGHTTEHGEVLCTDCVDDLQSLYGAVVAIGLNPIFLDQLDNSQHLFTCARCGKVLE